GEGHADQAARPAQAVGRDRPRVQDVGGRHQHLAAADSVGGHLAGQDHDLATQPDRPAVAGLDHAAAVDVDPPGAVQVDRGGADLSGDGDVGPHEGQCPDGNGAAHDDVAVAADPEPAGQLLAVQNQGVPTGAAAYDLDGAQGGRGGAGQGG